ncbi:MAG: porphobilinogen synthase [Caulobacterales bacterium]|nr:porphobilinogen synthase [Caulobacterales bacterium]
MPAYPITRPRRLRRTPWLRRLAAETRPSVDDLVWALVISDRADPREPVPSMPGVERLSPAEAARAAKEARDLGVPAVALFPHIDPAKKDLTGSQALNPGGLVCDAVKAIKDAAPEIGIISDVALDPFTDHGHDGVLREGVIVNDETVELLARGAVVQAEAGVDVVAPSDMMDGRVGAVRAALDAAGYADVAILSYAAKYASAFYGPYREAIGTAAALSGDKKTYQMDPANAAEALREVALDLDEGADMVMVKPGLPYLDIVRDIVAEFGAPTLAFQVSGEYAMLMAAARNGWLDEERAMLETLSSFKRAGAAGIITYFAPAMARALARR